MDTFGSVIALSRCINKKREGQAPYRVYPSLLTIIAVR